MELLKVKNLRKVYSRGTGFLGLKRKDIAAVDDVSFHIGQEETLGLVGESGCGKSTTGRLILRLVEPTSGEVFFGGRDIAKVGAAELRAYRKDVQLIFQDSFASLNPRMRSGNIVEEALHIHRIGDTRRDRCEMVRGIFGEVGLRSEQVERYPHEFSGGQRQRIGIARAICLKPKLVVCDEPVSALDVSVQAQIINMMRDLQENHKLSYLFISHDLSVVKHISNRVAVMYLGKIVEIAGKKEFFDAPLHPYSQALISAIPIFGHARTKRIILQGEIGTADLAEAVGCNFHPRCWMATDRCREEIPSLREMAPGHFAACHLI